jgi:hypothetical protein
MDAFSEALRGRASEDKSSFRLRKAVELIPHLRSKKARKLTIVSEIKP